MAAGAAFLHLHSRYSILEGVDSPRTLAGRAAEMGYGSVALTDRNSIAGAWEWVDACRAVGVRPLIGACLHHNGRHAVALIAEREGYTTLCQVLARVNRPGGGKLEDVLCQHSEGLQVLVDDTAAELTATLDTYLDQNPRPPREEVALIAAEAGRRAHEAERLAGELGRPREALALPGAGGPP